MALPIFLTALWVDADKFWWDGTAGTLWNIGASLGVASLVTGALYAADTLETTVQIPVQGAIATALVLALGSLTVIMIWTGMGGDSVSDALLSIGELRWLWQ